MTTEDYNPCGNAPSSVQCQSNAVQYFFAGFDRSSRVRNKSAKEKKKVKTKKFKDISLNRREVCTTSQNDDMRVEFSLLIPRWLTKFP